MPWPSVASFWHVNFYYRAERRNSFSEAEKNNYYFLLKKVAIRIEFQFSSSLIKSSLAVCDSRRKLKVGFNLNKRNFSAQVPVQAAKAKRLCDLWTRWNSHDNWEFAPTIRNEVSKWEIWQKSLFFSTCEGDLWWFIKRKCVSVSLSLYVKYLFYAFFRPQSFASHVVVVVDPAKFRALNDFDKDLVLCSRAKRERKKNINSIRGSFTSKS